MTSFLEGKGARVAPRAVGLHTCAAAGSAQKEVGRNAPEVSQRASLSFVPKVQPINVLVTFRHAPGRSCASHDPLKQLLQVNSSEGGYCIKELLGEEDGKAPATLPALKLRWSGVPIFSALLLGSLGQP